MSDPRPEGNSPSPVPRLRRQTMATQVADDVRRRILSGELPEGRQLKQEQLAAEFGISKVPVREALHQLEAEGFVIQQFHRGAVVAGLSPSHAMEMFELRAEIEGWLFSVAMRRATTDDIAEARRVAGLIEQTDDQAAYPGLNWQFHEALYRPAGKEYALDLVRKMHSQLDRYVRLQFTLATQKEQVIREHLELLELYAARKTRAREALRLHILNAAKQLATRLEGLGAASA